MKAATPHPSSHEPKHPRHQPAPPAHDGCGAQDGDGRDGIGGGMADIRNGGQTGNTGTGG